MFAQKEAKALGKGEVTNHLLLGLIAKDNKRSPEGFLSSGVTIERAREVASTIWNDDELYDRPAMDVPFSLASNRVFETTIEISRKMGQKYISPEHIANALFNVNDDAGVTSRLQRLGANKEELAFVANSGLQGELAKEGREPFSTSLALLKKSTSGALTTLRCAGKKKEKGALVDFCVDITASGSEGKIDHVVGRDKEVQRVIHILAHGTKSNPILLGEPGVGKTAIAKGLAISIVLT